MSQTRRGLFTAILVLSHASRARADAPTHVDASPTEVAAGDARGAPIYALDEPTPTPVGEVTRERWRPSIGAHIAAYDYAAPREVAAPIVFIDLTHETRSLWSSSFRLSMSRTPQRDVDRPSMGGTIAADLRWTTVHADACVFYLPMFPRLWFRPCGRIGVGRVEASSRGNIEPTKTDRNWMTVGAVARLQWRLFDPILLELQAGGDMTILRDTFAFVQKTTRSDDTVKAYTTPSWIPFASVGFAVALP